MHPLYHTWSGIRARCTNPKNPNWPNYGGRGIRICERWLQSFEAFVADVGERPSAAHSIDRRDNDGHYEPGNVRWATAGEQAANKRRPLRRVGLVAVSEGGRMLAAWRAQGGVAAAVLAQLVGVSTETVFRLETSANVPRLQLAAHLKRVADVPVKAWLEPARAAG